jgi:dihydroorotate dehydrogenase subfamily 1
MQLKTTVAGIPLDNPLMPASGPLTGDAHKMLEIARLGVGAMVTKTISAAPARVPRPCIYGDKNSIMNTELWSEHGPDVWLREFLPAYRAGAGDRPLFVSAGYRREELEELIPKLDPFADAFELSTHYVGKDLNAIGETIAAVRAVTKKPVFVKLSPHIPDPVAFAQVILQNGGSGVVAINSLGPTMKIDLKSRGVLFGNADGEAWTSGPVIKNMAVALVHKIKKALPECAVIGVGGVASAEDVLEFLLAGADAVQMLSAAMLRGRELYAKILRDLPGALTKYGFSSVEEVTRATLKTGDIRFDRRMPVVNDSLCKHCGVCERNCPYFAIEMTGRVTVKENSCFGCGLCESLCPSHAIGGAF